jgi:hypothetical protein
MHHNRSESMVNDGHGVLVIEAAGAHAGQHVAEERDVMLQVVRNGRSVEYCCSGASTVNHSLKHQSFVDDQMNAFA